MESWSKRLIHVQIKTRFLLLYTWMFPINTPLLFKTHCVLQHNFLVDVIFQHMRTVNRKQMAQQVLLIDDYMLCEAWEQRKIIWIWSSWHHGRCRMKGQSRFSLRLGVFGWFLQTRIKMTTCFMCSFTMSITTESVALFTPVDLFFGDI